MQPSSRNFQSREETPLLEAQRSAIEMASKFNTLAVNYAVDLNKTWFDLLQKQVQQYSILPQRLAECRTPEEVYFAQKDLIEKATQSYKQDLSTYADMVGKATQSYKEGLDQLASVGELLRREATRTVRQGQKAVQTFASETSRTVKGGREAAESAARGQRSSGRSARTDEHREEQPKQAH